MSELIGLTMTSVRAALGGNPASDLDTSGHAIAVPGPANATVCKQKPATGAPLAGPAVTLTVAAPGRC